MSSLARVPDRGGTTEDYHLLWLTGHDAGQGKREYAYRRGPTQRVTLRDSASVCLAGRMGAAVPLASSYRQLSHTTSQTSYRALVLKTSQDTDPLAELDRLGRLVSKAWKPGRSALDLLLGARR